MGGKYHNISELAQILNLKDPKTGKLKTHVIRFWETQIKEIKADKIINKRRYYSENKVELSDPSHMYKLPAESTFN